MDEESEEIRTLLNKFVEVSTIYNKKYKKSDLIEAYENLKYLILVENRF